MKLEVWKLQGWDTFAEEPYILSWIVFFRNLHSTHRQFVVDNGSRSL
jgi:hypothetical protein